MEKKSADGEVKEGVQERGGSEGKGVGGCDDFEQQEKKMGVNAEVNICDLPGEVLSSILWQAGSVYFIESVAMQVCRAFYHAVHTRPLPSLVRKRLSLDLLSCFEDEGVVLPPDGLAALLTRLPFIEHIRLTREGYGDLEDMLYAVIQEGPPKGLISLDLSFCGEVEAACLETVLPSMEHLAALSLESTQVVGDFVSPRIGHLFSTLQMLDLSYMRFECPRAHEIANATNNLLYLNLDEHIIPESTVIAFLRGCSKLTYASLDCQGHSEAVVETLARQTTRLRFLSIRFCEEFTANACRHVQQLEHLQWLRLKKLVRVPPPPLIDLFGSGAMQHITRLDLTECHQLSDDVVVAIAEACPRLTHALFAWCTRLDIGISALTQCIHLQFLDLTGLKQLSNDAVNTLLAEGALPDLTFLSLKQCNSMDDDLLLRHKQARPRLTIIDYFGNEIGHGPGEMDFDLGYFAADVFDAMPSMFADEAVRWLHAPLPTP